MKTTEGRSISNYVGPRTATLLEELGEECQHVTKLLAQLELRDLPGAQREDLLGELSAAILHLHEHTRGLEDALDAGR
jgi:hypothetical protein